MLDLSKPPPHTIPYRELLAKLHDQTKLLAVLDPILGHGRKLETGPFPRGKRVSKW